MKHATARIVVVCLAASIAGAAFTGIFASYEVKQVDHFEDFRVGNYAVAEVKRTSECRVALFVGKVLLQADLDAMSCTVVKQGIPETKRVTRGRKLIAMLRQ